MARVVMFVLNDCRHDARVLREAATLAAAGHTVTIVARTVDPYAPAGEREDRDGFTILRAPVAAGLLRWALLGRRPPVLARAVRAQAVAWLHGGPGGLARLAGASLVALVAVVVLALPAALLALLLALRRRPAFRPSWLWLESRLQWRLGVMPWTAQAVAAAPPADIAHAHDLRALPAARAVRDRDGARLVYDSHEIFTEAGANATRPARARAEMLRLERRLAAGADALITVNDDVAAVLRERLGQDDIVVIRNVLPPRGVRLDEPSPLRAACGLDAATPLLLCHGTFVPHRGFEPVA
ncbi:MAG TPA: glycosyltransferase, partial [Candidatus Limnocylindrales bacterium]